MAGYLGSLAAAIELGRLGNVPVSYEMMMHALDAQAELRYLRQPPARAAGA